jgi:hypothetical protein
MSKQKKEVRKIKEKGRTLCYRCGRPIDTSKDNYIQVISRNMGKVIEDFSFHISCWQDFNQDKVTQRLQETVQHGLSMLQGRIA